MSKKSKPSPPPLPTLHIRWMIRRDMPEVLEIDSASFDDHWDHDAFIRLLRQRNCIGMVCEFQDKVVGYMLYNLHRTRLEVLRLAVCPSHRRKGVGRKLGGTLVGKLSPNRRQRVTMRVNEGALDSQLFLKAIGFLAVGIEDDYIDFAFRLGSEPPSFTPKNRIAKYLECEGK